MLILDTITTKSSKIFFCKIQQLPLNSPITNNLPLCDQQIITSTKGKHRVNERLTARICLKTVIGKKYKGINYRKNGQPYLVGQDENISISHSKDILSIIISNSPDIGIDIQLPSEKIKKIAKRVFNQDELDWAKNEIEKLTYLWCIKEAVFKASSIKGLDFRKEIIIDTSSFFVKVKTSSHEQDYKMETLKFKDYCVAYTL